MEILFICFMLSAISVCIPDKPQRYYPQYNINHLKDF